jgi:hypothetical protein
MRKNFLIYFVRLSLSTTKNINKKCQELVNRQADFDETKKFGINMKNYTRKNNRSTILSFMPTEIRQE